MSRTRSPIPTVVEIQILRVLWSGGAQTVQQITDELRIRTGEERHYNTVLTILRILVSKDYARSKPDTKTRGHLFEARLLRVEAQRLAIAYVAKSFFSNRAELKTFLFHDVDTVRKARAA